MLAPALAAMASLTAIDLSGNNEGDEGMRALGEGLLACTSCKIQSFECSKLYLQADATSLDLSHEQLGPGAAVLLSAAMTKFMASVTSVDVGYNEIGKEAALELINIFKQKQMVSVGLAQCGLGPQEAAVVADMIHVIPSVTSLSLGGNSLGDEGVTAICEAMQSNKEIKLASLELKANNVGPTGATFVAAMVAVVASISLQKLPAWRQLLGIVIGFAGVVLIVLGDTVSFTSDDTTISNATAEPAASTTPPSLSALGIVLCLLCALSFSLSAAGAVPLQQKMTRRGGPFGFLPVVASMRTRSMAPGVAR